MDGDGGTQVHVMNGIWNETHSGLHDQSSFCPTSLLLPRINPFLVSHSTHRRRACRIACTAIGEPFVVQTFDRYPLLESISVCQLPREKINIE